LNIRWNYFDWKYESDIHSLGYHGGIGFEYEGNLDSVNKDTDASGIFELVGNEIKLLGDKSTFMYAQRFGGGRSMGRY